MQARIEKRDTDWIIITDDETYSEFNQQSL